MPESVAVTWMSSGLLAGLRISAIAQAAGNRAVEAGRENRAAVDGDDVMRARRGEADFQQVVRAAPRMQRRAAAALAMRVDDVGRPARRGRPAPAPRPPARASTDDIRRATSAAWRSRRRAEMLADRRDAFVARLVDVSRDAGGRDGRRPARPSPSRPAAHRAHRPALPACRRCRRRDGRGGRW